MATRTNNTLVLTIVAAAIGLGYAFLVFRPNAVRIAEKRNQMHAARLEITKAQHLRREIRETEDVLKETQAFNTAWRTESRTDDLFAQITEQASQAGCKMRRFDPHPVIRRELLIETPINATLEGEFAAIFEFLRSLEQLGATLWLNEFEAKSTGKDGQRLRCDLSLSIFSANSDFSD